MNDLSRDPAAVIGHLVQAHGADQRHLIANSTGTEYLQWVHFDTHAALEIAGLRPPDRHAHSAPVELGLPLRVPAPSLTSLPQTLAAPGLEIWRCQVTGWASAALLRNLAYEVRRASMACGPAVPQEDRPRKQGRLDEDDLEQAATEIRERIRAVADAAAARWLARTSFPARHRHHDRPAAAALTQPGESRPPAPAGSRALASFPAPPATAAPPGTPAHPASRSGAQAPRTARRR
jgi:hypothetical protein